MNKIQQIILLTIFTINFCNGQNSKYESPADKLIYELNVYEKSIVNENVKLDVKFPNRIACLTGIFPKKVDGTYLGLIYYPNNDEIKAWKNWITENRTKLKYGELIDGEKEILYEYEFEKFRSNNCE